MSGAQTTITHLKKRKPKQGHENHWWAPRQQPIPWPGDSLPLLEIQLPKSLPGFQHLSLAHAGGKLELSESGDCWRPKIIPCSLRCTVKWQSWEAQVSRVPSDIQLQRQPRHSCNMLQLVALFCQGALPIEETRACNWMFPRATSAARIRSATSQPSQPSDPTSAETVLHRPLGRTTWTSIITAFQSKDSRILRS